MSGLLAFAAGATKGAAGVTQGMYNDKRLEMRDRRLAELKGTEWDRQHDIRRSDKAADTKDNRQYAQDALDDNREYTEKQDTLKHDRAVSREEANRKPDYSHLKIKPALDEYGEKSGGYGMVDKTDNSFTKLRTGPSGPTFDMHSNRLRNNRNMAAKFDKKYGAGAAKKVLGNMGK